ncbi:MAG: cytochrome c family protein [Pseudomonadota bacterium]
MVANEKNKKLAPVLAAFLAAVTLSSNAAAMEGDAVKGKKVFKKCAACHTVGESAKNKVGPVLNDVVGRPAGTFADYKYGKSIIAAGEAGLVWNEEELFIYLVDPRKYLRAKLDDKKAKSKMTFKLKKEQDRLDVIAYLKTFSAPIEGEETEETEEKQSES